VRDAVRVSAKIISLLFAALWFVFLFSFSGNRARAGSDPDAGPPFVAAWWCRGAHVQTILGNLWRDNPKIPYRRERLELPDGDFLDLDWLDGDTRTPLVVILHGLGGSSNSSYVLTLLDEIRQKGWRAVVMNARGMSGEPNRLKVTSHSGQSEDLNWTLQKLLGDPQNQTIYLAGYSRGGNVLLKWLGEKGAAVPPSVKKAVVVSVPYDLVRTTSRLDRGFNREIYTRWMLRPLKAYALHKAGQFPGLLDTAAIQQASTFQSFDDTVTAPLNGFANARDYWTRVSSALFLDKIRTPVLLIHADNDPLLPGALLPHAAIRASPFLTLLITRDGGHLGFLAGRFPWQQERWLEGRILDFFSAEAPVESPQPSAANLPVL
jgi:predicted alpha/beta-fold hydrolase